MVFWKIRHKNCLKLFALSPMPMTKTSINLQFYRNVATIKFSQCTFYLPCSSNSLFDKHFNITYHYVFYRTVHLSQSFYDKSKLEDSLKEKQKQKKSFEMPSAPSIDLKTEKVKETAKVTITPSIEQTKPTKAPLWRRVLNEVKHYYHGFRLLILDIRIASRTLWKLMRGKPMVRRERNQFRRAVSDIFRLVPFSVFIIIPFAEIALPFALKLFPGMLPSTFETSSKKENRLKKQLKVKLEMAKFLQDTVEDIAVHTSRANKENAASKQFIEFFQKTRSSHQAPTNEEILQHAKLFKDDLTLDNIDRPQLMALCRLIQVPAVGTNEVMRLLIHMKLNNLHRDDELIMKEGVDSLTTPELMTACQARGMRALGVPRKRLKQQLSEWVELHVKHDVPSSLLLLSRVLYLPESIPTEERVKAAISTLPEKVADKAEVTAAEIKLERVDNTALYKVARQEQAAIKSESAAKAKMEKAVKDQATLVDASIKSTTEILTDTKPQMHDKEILSEGPILVDSAKAVRDDNTITQQDIDAIDEAIHKIKSKESSDTGSVKNELRELREDVDEYKSDKKTLTDELKLEEYSIKLRDTKAGELIHRQIEKMIKDMEIIVQELESTASNNDTKTIDEVAIYDLVGTMESLTKLPEEKLKYILDALDSNKDGHIDVEDARKVITILNQEDVQVTAQQLEQIVKLLTKLNSTKSAESNINKEKVIEATNATE